MQGHKPESPRAHQRRLSLETPFAILIVLLAPRNIAVYSKTPAYVYIFNNPADHILNCHSGVSSEIALRLSKALRRSPESWLTMQDNYNLWQARQTIDLDAIEKIEFRAA